MKYVGGPHIEYREFTDEELELSGCEKWYRQPAGIPAYEHENKVRYDPKEWELRGKVYIMDMEVRHGTYRCFRKECFGDFRYDHRAPRWRPGYPNVKDASGTETSCGYSDFPPGYWDMLKNPDRSNAYRRVDPTGWMPKELLENEGLRVINSDWF